MARDRLDLRHVCRPHDVQLIATSGELQVRLDHEECVYRSERDPDVE